MKTLMTAITGMPNSAPQTPATVEPTSRPTRTSSGWRPSAPCMSFGCSQFTSTVCTPTRMIVTGMKPARVDQRGHDRGDERQGGPKKGMSMTSADSVRDAGRGRGCPKMPPTTATRTAWIDGEDELGAQEAAERARHGALEDEELVLVPIRDDAVHLGEDPVAVDDHVERQDQDEDERAERRDGDAGDRLDLVEELRADRADLVLERLEHLDQVDLEAPELERLLPGPERGLDVARLLGERARQLAELLGDRRAGVEQDEAEADERQRVDERRREAPGDVRAVLDGAARAG